MPVRKFTMEYWIDDGWYIGRLREVPGAFSQGKTLEDLEVNIREACRLIIEDSAVTIAPLPILSKEIEVAV